MVVIDYTFWQGYGPVIVTGTVLFVIGMVLMLVGGGAARAYERVMVSSVAEWRGMSMRRREKRRAAYVSSVAEWRRKARKARRVQMWAVYAVVAVPVLAGVRPVLDAVVPEWTVRSRWLVVACVLVAVLAVTAYLERRRASGRQVYLRQETEFDERSRS